SDDIDLLRKTWSTGLDPSKVVVAERPYGSKALIDACKPHRHLSEFPPCTLLRRSVYESVTRRWQEFGLDGRPPTLSGVHGGRGDATAAVARARSSRIKQVNLCG